MRRVHYKTILVVAILIALIPILCVCVFLRGKGYVPSDSVVPEKLEEPQDIEPEIEPEVQDKGLKLDIEDFNKRPLSELEDKYGKAKIDEAELPAFSWADWELDKYNIHVEYAKGENIIYGMMIDFKEVGCDSTLPDREVIKKVLEILGIEYKVRDWRFLHQVDQSMYRYGNTNHLGWEEIRLICSNFDNYVYISAESDGFEAWLLQY